MSRSTWTYRALLLAPLLAGCVTVPPQRPAAPPAKPVPSGVGEFVTALNRHRARVGCPALVWDDAVERVAQAHSEDMLRRRYFSHTTPEGRTLRDRIVQGGIVGFTGAGENLAQFPGGGRDLLDFWLSSPAHRENVETCEYTHHGLGRAGELWTHVFLIRRPVR
jgi:uncharacterized protein YkwD